MTHPTWHRLRDKLAAVLAREAGVESSSRIYNRFQSEANSRLSACDFKPPADTAGAVGALLLQHFEANAAWIEERERRTAIGAARVAAQRAERDAPKNLAPGHVRLVIRDETSGLAFEVDLPEKIVRQVAR